MGATVLATPQQLLSEFQLIEQAWKLAEEKLAETLVPIDVKVKVKSGTICDEDNGFQTIGDHEDSLAYVKAKGSRRICWVHEYTIYGNNPETVTRPVVECPVDLRIELFDHYERLYREAEAVAKSYVPKLREAREKFEKLLSKINPNALSVNRKIVKLPNEHEA